MAFYSIYFSPTGGVKNVADQLVSAWGEVSQIDLSDPVADFSACCFGPDDVCLLAFPVYEGRVPPVVLQRLRRMTAQSARCVPAAVYGNRAVDDALLEMRNEAMHLGFLPVAAVSAVAHHSLLTSFAIGRPDEQDRAELQAFSKKIKAVALTATQPVDVPGKQPYIELNIQPTFPLFNASVCTGCGLCAEKCPVGAIDRADPSRLDTSICARCVRCVRSCPTNARHFDQGRIAATEERMASLFAERKANKLYL